MDNTTQEQNAMSCKARLTHCRPKQTLNHEHVGLHQPQPKPAFQRAQSKGAPTAGTAKQGKRSKLHI